jgi:hypothetical protein
MTEIELVLEAGECNGLMTISITDKNKSFVSRPTLHEGVNKIKLSTIMPNTLIISLDNKNNRKDTILDSQSQKVIKDKYVKVIDFIMDGKPFPKDRVSQMFEIKTRSNGTIKTSYWGFNGEVTLDLPHDDSLKTHLSNII